MGKAKKIVSAIGGKLPTREEFSKSNKKMWRNSLRKKWRME